ncbi:MAG: hypothetical protein WC729_29145 [Sphingomonas sp.]|uniref:hypothetical protein n=1 Tax=Sphingomonas sp. TaxID=28214 RepID=UPI00356B4A66
MSSDTDKMLALMFEERRTNFAWLRTEPGTRESEEAAKRYLLACNAMLDFRPTPAEARQCANCKHRSANVTPTKGPCVWCSGYGHWEAP